MMLNSKQQCRNCYHYDDLATEVSGVTLCVHCKADLLQIRSVRYQDFVMAIADIKKRSFHRDGTFNEGKQL